MKWIKCSDRLPEIGSQVICYASGTYGGISTCDYRYSNYDKKKERDPIFVVSFNNCCGCNDQIFDVTHWMPLPQPPKDKE